MNAYLENNLKSDYFRGTFQYDTSGTFHSAEGGTFVSDTDGTLIPILSSKQQKNSYNFNTEVITVFIVTYVYIALRVQVIREPSPDYSWIDEGFSMTQSISGSTIQLSADISQLEPGTHQFYCRVQASNGTWSDIYVSEFTIEAPVLQEAFIEYFIDIDPGYGNANVVKEIEQGTNKISVDLANTAAGAHVLYLRSRDEYGRWSSTVARPLYVCKHADIVALEYFFDSDDPGCGNATQVALPSDLNSSFTFEVPLNHLKLGEHLLNVRAKRSDGLWSVISSDVFTIEAVTSINGMSDDMVPTITYSLKGYKVTASKGVNIVRDKDGKTKKTINK